MEKIKSSLTWVSQNISFAFGVALVIVYVIWFWLADTYIEFGLILISIYSFLVILFRKTKPRSCLSIVILVPAAFFLLANLLYIINAFPRIEKIAIYNRTIYIITYQYDILEPEYDWHQVRTWKWGFIPGMDGLSNAWGDLRFIYDEQTKVVGIVRESRGYEWLIYTNDSERSRHYKERVEHNNQFFIFQKTALT